ncbi:PRP40 pre-mRNA processing factor 40 [Mortierella claussenii]|nr:PRP40 pre-mRNA processing factor 40 [Mortierella claussenii]
MVDSQPKSLWVEYTHQDGRKYYYHPTARQTVWQKPDELKTPKELALETSPWKEYTTPEGKKYYHNASTKETVWTVPEDYKILLDELAEEAKAKGSTTLATSASPLSIQIPVKPQTPTSSSMVSTPSPLRHQATLPGGGQLSPVPNNPPQHQISHPPQQQGQQAPLVGMRDHSGPESLRATGPPSFAPPHLSSRPPFSHPHGPRPPRFQQSFVSPEAGGRGRERNPNETPEFSTKEEAEEAFKNLLKETGVTSTWTWEQTMRAVVTNPMYRVLKTTAERKTAFQEYVDERRIQEKQEEKALQEKQKQDFMDLLKSSDKVSHASRYTTVSRLFADEPAFKAFEDDQLRFQIFDGFVSDLIRQEKEEARQKRKAGMAAMLALLQIMDEITLTTRWAEAKQLLTAKKEFMESTTIQGLSKVDQLTVFEDHIKHSEDKYDQKRVRDRMLRKRADRKRREAFKELLAELRKAGRMNAKTCWTQIHPLIKQDPRYLDILGQSGSSPMELFWDLIEDLDERLYQDRKMIQDVLRNVDYEIHPETKFEDFKETLSKESRAASLPTEDLQLIFEQLVGKAIHHAKEEKRRQEKLARKKAESFRFMLKSLTPAVTVESTWDEVRSRAESTPEHISLETEEKRKEVFDRYIERLKERLVENHNSDDEDGSILEDDADYHGKRSSSDRKRLGTSSGHSKHYHASSGSSSSHHHGGHHSNGDHHRKDTLGTREPSSTESSKSSRANGKHDRSDIAGGDSANEGDPDRKAKKVKAVDGDDTLTETSSKKDTTLVGTEEGEVIETEVLQ